MQLKSKNKCIDLTNPHVMGIINFTPDSFSDGGQYNSLDMALSRADAMLKAGVTFLDVGGESTRPGAKDVSLNEELDRVVPLVEALRSRFDAWISVDTSKAIVMQEAVGAGADLINDIRALREPNALEMAAKLDVPICLMHMQGQPRVMQQSPHYNDLLNDVDLFLQERIEACRAVGISKDKLILDPGFGFGKTLEHNYELLANLNKMHHFGLPILAGMSRKSMIFNLVGEKPQDCISGSLACASIALMQGAQIIRVHDFKETLQVMAVCKATLKQRENIFK